MSSARYRRAVMATAAIALASSCSSSGGSIGTGGKSGMAGSTMQCAGGAGGASGEPPLEQFDPGDGIPVEQFRHAMAVARCGFWNRCSKLAPFVVSQCIDALTANVPWTYQECAGTLGMGGCVTVTTRYVQPSEPLLRGVASGTVLYAAG